MSIISNIISKVTHARVDSPEWDRRTSVDRRQRPTPVFSRYWLFGRRKGGQERDKQHEADVGQQAGPLGHALHIRLEFTGSVPMPIAGLLNCHRTGDDALKSHSSLEFATARSRHAHR